MKRFTPQPAPDHFDEQVRRPGRQWLETHPQGRPPDYWQRARGALADAFEGLCAYSVIHLFETGTVDHFVSIDEARDRAYDWSNYRYCAGWVNASKGNIPSALLMDPFEVQDDWFEIQLPSLQLRVTDACPQPLRERAEFTIRRLRLRDGERAIRGRQNLMELHLSGELPLESLEAFCPLLARALRSRR